MIMITAADDDDDDDAPLNLRAAEADLESGVGGVESLSRAANNSQRVSQQIIVATSSTSAAAAAAGVDNETNRHPQLPAIIPHSMNGSNNSPAPSSLVQNHHLALTYFTHHEHLHPILQQQHERRVSELPSQRYRNTFTSPPPPQDQSNPVYQIPIRARDAIATTLSALYGKLIVVMGIAFPMAEVISTYIPPSFYEASHLESNDLQFLKQVIFLMIFSSNSRSFTFTCTLSA